MTRVVSFKVTADTTQAQRAGDELRDAYARVSREIESKLAGAAKLEGLRQATADATARAGQLTAAVTALKAQVAEADKAAKGALREELKRIQKEANTAAKDVTKLTTEAGKLEAKLASGAPVERLREQARELSEAANTYGVAMTRLRVAAIQQQEAAVAMRAGLGNFNQALSQAATLASRQTQFIEAQARARRQLELESTFSGQLANNPARFASFEADQARARRQAELEAAFGPVQAADNARQAALAAAAAQRQVSDEVDKSLDGLRRRNALLGAGTELERVNRLVTLGAYSQYNAAQLQQLRNLAAEYDAKQKIRVFDKQRTAGNFAQGLTSTIGFGFGSAGVAAGVGTGLATLFSVQQFLALERAQSALTAVSGSLSSSADQMRFVQAEARRLGIDVATLSKAYAQFSAASKGTTLEGEKATRIFGAIAAAGQKLNLQTVEVEGALRAVSQMMSKGTVQSEELRGQLGDRLPGAVNIMARALGVTTGKLQNMLEQGQVLSDDALPKFAAELERTFNLSQSDRINTLAASFGRLTGELKLAAAAVGGAMAPSLQEASEQASNFFRVARESPLQAIALQVAGVMAGLLSPNGSTLNEGVNAYFAETAKRLEDADRAALKFAESANILKKLSVNDILAGNVDQQFFVGAPKTPFPQGFPSADFAKLTETQKRKLEADREELATLGLKTEKEKVLWQIRQGSLRDEPKALQNAQLALAVARDNLRAVESTGKATGKQIDQEAILAKIRQDSLGVFEDNLRKETAALESQAALKDQLRLRLIAAEEGDTAASRARLKSEYDKWLKELGDSAEGANLAKALFNAENAKIQLGETQAAFQAIVDRARSGIEGRNDAASASGVGAREKRGIQQQNAVEAARALAELQVKFEQVQSNGPATREQTKAFEEQRQALIRIKQAADELSRSPFQGAIDSALDLDDALSNTLVKSFDGVADKLSDVATGGAADFREMADSIIKDIIRIQIRAALAGLISNLFPSFAPGGNTPEITRSPAAIAGSTGTGGGSLDFAGLAGGGKVNGIGTGTSDSNLRWLSDGEFVIRASSVEKFGTGLFEMLNAGIKPPSLGARARGMASGGYVGKAPRASNDGGVLVQIINSTSEPVRTERSQTPDGRSLERVFIGQFRADMATRGEMARAIEASYQVNRRPGSSR